MGFMDNFPVEDITHKPMRMQSAVGEETLTPPTTEGNTVQGSHQTYTLQSAVDYYREHSGESILNKQTALWLCQLLEHLEDIRKKKRAEVKEILRESEEEESFEDTSE